MSQSDYIKYKRVSNQLRIDNTTTKQKPVFDCQKYLDFKQYALENTIINTNLDLNKLVPSGYQRVFDMDKIVGNCASFPVCTRTDLRTNRVPMSTVYFTPTYQPNNIKIVNKGSNLKNDCDCSPNSSSSDSSICRCRLGAFGIVR